MGTKKSWWKSDRGPGREGPGDGRGRVTAGGLLAGILLMAVAGAAGAETAGRPAIAAHRGGARLWPENSLTAFRGAIGLGVDLVELDVHQTKDGEVVVVHDPTLDRTTTGHGVVLDFSWSELGAVTIRGTADERLPRLAEVLALLRPTPVGLLLEIKSAPRGGRYPGIEERVLTLLQEAELTDRTRVMAFDWTILERLRALSPRVRLTGLLARKGSERVGGVEGVAPRLRALGVNDLGIEHALLIPAAVRAAHDAGLSIGVWTVNEPEELRRALAAGVDYVTTDQPDLALRLRAARP
ncbi:MAG TPA: glycerophosphodiester phosphodiesterase family protein [Methylomirabilota bacterium]